MAKKTHNEKVFLFLLTNPKQVSDNLNEAKLMSDSSTSGGGKIKSQAEVRHEYCK